MKKFVVLAIVFAAVAFVADSATKGLGARIECLRRPGLEPRIYESKIKEAIYKLAEQLRNEGIPSLNISSVDPFVLDNTHLQFENDMIEMDWLMSDGSIVGATYFNITKLTLSLAGFKFTYGFQWPSIHGKGSYSMDGVVGGFLPIFGKGDFDVEAKNIVIEGSGKLGSDENKFLFLENFSIKVSMEAFIAQITGLMNDPALSKIISVMLSDSVPALLDNFHEKINRTVSPIVVDFANKFLENKTLSDIINGLGRDIHCGDPMLLY